jgi:2-polyprenyl-3-methyl-5-hydroxy-6-metoxy-1,4-benzoquinol methylase
MLDKKNYNTTDLDPKRSFEKHVFHRDQFAHYFRWSHILKQLRIGQRICDFGCGGGALLEVAYRNMYKQEIYVGLDIREKTIAKAKEAFADVNWAKFFAADLCKKDFKYELIRADHVCSFEVIEHIGKQNAHAFLENFKACGREKATYYLSTPNFNANVGAAGNHIYDAGDGRGKVPQEFEHSELEALLSEHFTITKKYGTFASQRDYITSMDEHQLSVYNRLKEYFDVTLLANFMAPMFPELSRNTLWIMKAKV